MRKSTALIALLAAASLSLTGCGFGTADTFTQQMQPAGNGAHTRVAALQIQAVVLVSHPDGGASLSATILNNADATDAVAAIVIGQTQATLTPTEITLPPNSLTRIGFNSDLSADVADSLAIGSTENVAILFASGATAKLTVLVVDQSGPYADITAAAAPTAG